MMGIEKASLDSIKLLKLYTFTWIMDMMYMRIRKKIFVRPTCGLKMKKKNKKKKVKVFVYSRENDLI